MLATSRPTENARRHGNVHGHIVAVNEAHQEAWKRQQSDLDTTAVQEEILHANRGG